MLSAITFNSLVWEDSNIPFPDEVKPLIKEDFYSRIWNSAGLPINGAKYSVVNGMLYLEEDQEGNATVRQQDFSGCAAIGIFVENPDKSQDSYLCSFKVVFVNGKVANVTVNQIEPKNTLEHEQKMFAANQQILAVISRRSKFWYRWLYLPYYLIVRFITLIIVWVFRTLMNITLKIATFLTPL